jgi:hypothetical protein
MGRLTLAAHKPEATVKTAIATSMIRRPPNLLVSEPLTGSPAASATRSQ